MNRKVMIAMRSPSPWKGLLEEYFSEVFVEILSEKDAVTQDLGLIFLDPEMCQPGLVQKIRVSKSLNPDLRVFSLGECTKEIAGIFDVVFKEACDLFEFSKKIADKIVLPESIRLLVADDDPDILSMICDYFDGRHAPAFEVLRASNGREAWDWIQKKRPDSMILDVKMPLMTGSELYCKLQKQNEHIPTVIFFDAISAGDLNLIKKAGQPVIVEKGYRDSSMSYLMATIKKLVYFNLQ